jgi:hypothetical protein
VPDADGSVGGVLCIVSETTERVRAEAALRDLNEIGRTSRPSGLTAYGIFATWQLPESTPLMGSLGYFGCSKSIRP